MAIRIFGIYLIVLAITTIPTLISYSLSLYYQQSSKEAVITGYDEEGEVTKESNVRDMMRTIHMTTVATFTACVVKLLLFTGLGVYFLKGGKLMFRLVCPPDLGESVA